MKGLNVWTWSRGLRRALRVGEGLLHGLVGARRPVFPGRTAGQKSSRVIAHLRRVGWGGGVTAALVVMQG